MRLFFSGLLLCFYAVMGPISLAANMSLIALPPTQTIYAKLNKLEVEGSVSDEEMELFKGAKILIWEALRPFAGETIGVEDLKLVVAKALENLDFFGLELANLSLKNQKDFRFFKSGLGLLIYDEMLNMTEIEYSVDMEDQTFLYMNRGTPYSLDQIAKMAEINRQQGVVTISIIGDAGTFSKDLMNANFWAKETEVALQSVKEIMDKNPNANGFQLVSGGSANGDMLAIQVYEELLQERSNANISLTLITPVDLTFEGEAVLFDSNTQQGKEMNASHLAMGLGDPIFKAQFDGRFYLQRAIQQHNARRIVTLQEPEQEGFNAFGNRNNALVLYSDHLVAVVGNIDDIESLEGKISGNGGTATTLRLFLNHYQLNFEEAVDSGKMYLFNILNDFFSAK